jgi:hypothetical protein
VAALQPQSPVCQITGTFSWCFILSFFFNEGFQRSLEVFIYLGFGPLDYPTWIGCRGWRDDSGENGCAGKIGCAPRLHVSDWPAYQVR